MWRYVKVSGVIGSSTIVRLLAAWIRMKWLTTMLGPAGVGLVAQASQLVMCGAAITSQGIGTAMVKYLARAEDRPHILPAALGLQWRIVVPLALIVAVLAGPLAFALFADTSLWWALVWVAGALVLTNLSSVWESVFVGIQALRRFTAGRIVSDLISTGLLISLVWWWGRAGAFAHLALGALASCGIGYALLRAVRQDLKPVGSDARAMSHWRRTLVGYSVWLYLSMLLSVGTSLVIRSGVIHQLGADANGIYHAAYILSSLLFPFMTNPLWSRLFVELSQHHHDAQVAKQELDRAVTYAVVSALGIFGAVILFRRPLILLMASQEFLPATSLIPLQCAGDFLSVFTFLFGVSLWARGLGREKFFCDVAAASVWLVGAFAGLASGMGLLAIPLWYAVGQLVSVVALVTYHAVKFQYLPPLTLRWAMAMGVLALSGAGFFWRT